MNFFKSRAIAYFPSKSHATFWISLFLIGSYISLQAEPPRRSILTKSRQHTISSTLINPRPIPSDKAKPIPDYIHLSPYKLAHFVETVKDCVLRRLQLPPREKWIGRIHLNIFPGDSNDSIIFKRKRFINRWDYRLDLPEVMDSQDLVRAIVTVQLEEFAARNSAIAPPIPSWLIDGLTKLIQEKNGPLLFVPFQSAAGGVLNYSPSNDSMKNIRRIIQTSDPISFLDISLPPVSLQSGDGRKTLESYCALLVSKILSKPDGPKRMKFFLRELPKHKNNQHAFLTAFNFKSMLKAEQWWTLAQAQFRSRDAFNRWIPGIALTHLQDALQIKVPLNKKSIKKSEIKIIPIQEFLKTGTYDEHQSKLAPLLQKLIVIQISSPPKTARLIRDYRSTFGLYLKQDKKLDLHSKPSAQKTLLMLTIQKLEQLDVIFADLLATEENAEALGKHIRKPIPEVD